MDIEMLYMVATGQIANVAIELKVNDEFLRFEGREAEVFATGMIAGMKVEEKGCEHLSLVDDSKPMTLDEQG